MQFMNNPKKSIQHLQLGQNYEFERNPNNYTCFSSHKLLVWVTRPSQNNSTNPSGVIK